MSAEYERNIEDAEAVLSYMKQGARPEELYEEAVYGVHNGFCLRNENYLGVENLRREDYFSYTVDLHNYLDRKLDKDTAFYTVYRSRSGGTVDDHLGILSDRVDSAVASSNISGFIVDDEEKRKLAYTLNTLAKNAQITLCGEISGLCKLQFEDLLEQVNQRTDKDFEIKQGPSFPKKRLDRTGNRLHWEGADLEDDKPGLPISCI